VILVIDNYDSFTWNLVQRLAELDQSLEPGRDVLVVRNDAIDPDAAADLDGGRGPAGIIISPGPCTPAEAGVSRAIIERFGGVVPVLGVCLGHQTMADADGMRVVRHRLPMHGKTSSVRHDGQGLLAGLANPFEAARYHSLVVEADSVPPPAADGSGWVVSAWTDEVVDGHEPTRVVMGLRRVWAAGDPPRAPLEGVQFHPESFLTHEGPTLLGNFLRATAAHKPARADERPATEPAT